MKALNETPLSDGEKLDVAPGCLLRALIATITTVEACSQKQPPSAHYLLALE
jgi:hypothetical protein